MDSASPPTQPKKLKKEHKLYFRNMKDKKTTEADLHAFQNLQLNWSELQFHIQSVFFFPPGRVKFSHWTKATGIFVAR
jgi:hypothetical protein